MNKNSAFVMAPEGFGQIDRQGMRSLVAAASDIALLVGPDGKITEVYLGAELKAANDNDFGRWEGADITDIVTEDSRPKIAAMLAGAKENAPPVWREINHITGGEDNFPVRYAAIPSGHGGTVIMLGRDLTMVAQLQKRLMQAQLTMEQDYERIRQIETRYRVLFETTREALLILSADTGRIIDANSAAARIFGMAPTDLAGRGFAGLLAPASQAKLEDTLAQVRSTGRDTATSVALRSGGTTIGLDCLLFRSINETLFLLRLTPEAGPADQPPPIEHALQALYRQAGDAIVLTDSAGRILHANEAFLGLIGAAVSEAVRDTPLGDYLGRTGVDMNVMMTNARARGRLGAYATTLRGTFGGSLPVEISVTFLPDARPEGFGFVIRDASRSHASRSQASPMSPDAVENIIELVGSTPLKELVRGTTDVVERLCIETAIKLTNNNRASAAEMLGLSRQSLYVKLRKYGMLEHDDDEPEPRDDP